MSRRLLLFNLRTDADDHILGFTTGWINALAARYDWIDVVTMHRGRLAVADNVTVYSAGREQGYSRAHRLLRFYRLVTGLLLRHRYSACFAHMTPLFAGLAGPLLTLRGVPTTLWYTHRQHTRELVAGTRFSRRVVSAVESSFPVETAKLRPIGHGIETDFFVPGAADIRHSDRIVYVARLTDIKHQHTLIQAVADLDCEVILVGDIPDGYGADYKERLVALVDALALRERVIFTGAQTADQVRDWYQSATIAVNLSPPGLFDKAALEAMACAVPVVVSNPAFDPLTGPWRDSLHIASPEDVGRLRARLAHLLSLPVAERKAIGHGLRERMMAQHSLSALVDKLVSVLETGELPPAHSSSSNSITPSSS